MVISAGLQGAPIVPHRALAVLAAVLLTTSATAQEGYTVLRYPVVGTVPPDFDLRIQRLIAEVRDTDARALILDLDVWVGDFEVVRNAVALLLDARVPVYALVSGVALDVGAMIALATDSIYMVPGSSIGGVPDDDSAAQNPDSVRDRRDAMRIEFRTLADRRGLHRLLTESMVDPEVVIPRLNDEHRVLTLTAQGAVQFELAAAEVPSVDEVLSRLALADAQLVTANADGVTGTTIEVQNNGWSDIRIYLLRGGTRRRLGLVGGLSSAEYFVQHAEIAGGEGIRLYADPVGGSAGHATELIRVSPGLVVQWLLQNNLMQSSLFVHR